MFGKKETKPLEVPKDMRITTIPQDFYAGADPSVKFKETEKTVDLSKLSGSPLKMHEKKAFDASTAKGPAMTSTKWWVIGSVVLFVLFLGGAGIYYWLTLREKTEDNIPVPPQIASPITPVAPLSPEPAPEEIVAESTTTPETAPQTGTAGLELPSKLLSFSADMDNDGVSDAAEAVFGSDPGIADTDRDLYPDGHELYYLYNPNGFEPKKLIDSGVVKLFRSGNYNYGLYYPESWAVGSVDSEGRQVLFSTLTAENIEVRTFDKELGLTLQNWFESNAPASENFSDYRDFTSRFGSTGKARTDGLVYFFFTDEKVYALIYHVAESDTVNYKAVIDIMARSFYIITDGETAPEMMPEFAPVPTGTASSQEMNSTTTMEEKESPLPLEESIVTNEEENIEEIINEPTESAGESPGAEEEETVEIF